MRSGKDCMSAINPDFLGSVCMSQPTVWTFISVKIPHYLPQVHSVRVDEEGTKTSLNGTRPF